MKFTERDKYLQVCFSAHNKYNFLSYRVPAPDAATFSSIHPVNHVFCHKIFIDLKLECQCLSVTPSYILAAMKFSFS